MIIENMDMNKKIKECFILNDKNQLQNQGDVLFLLLKEYIDVVEKSNFTNEQWFIDWEMEANKLTVKDHNKQPTQ